MLKSQQDVERFCEQYNAEKLRRYNAAEKIVHRQDEARENEIMELLCRAAKKTKIKKEIVTTVRRKKIERLSRKK